MSRSPIKPLLTSLFTLGLFVFTANVAAADAPRPNILFIIFDDWSGNHAGARVHVR